MSRVVVLNTSACEGWCWGNHPKKPFKASMAAAERVDFLVEVVLVPNFPTCQNCAGYWMGP